MAKFTQIETFYWTVKLGKIDLAARKLFVTQSAATKRLQELEKQSNFPLFKNDWRKSGLTAKGNELFQYAEALILSFTDFTELRHQTLQPARIVKVGITEIVALTWFSGFVKEMSSIYPAVTVVPEVDHSQLLQKKLLNNELDIIILPGEYVTPMMETLHVQSVPFRWLCSPGALPSGVAVDVSALAEHPVIVQGPNSGITERCERLFAEAGLNFKKVYGSGSIFALVGLVKAGSGISCAPESLFRSDIEQGTLQVVKTNPEPTPVDYYAAFIKTSNGALGFAIATVAKKCADAWYTSCPIP